MLLYHHPRSDHAILKQTEYISYRGHCYAIPKGFLYNGANIPRWFWTLPGLHPWHPRVIRAALFHDYLYSRGVKDVADKGFKSLLKLDGCNRFQYMACYLAVRLFGGRHVNRGI